MIIGHFYVNTYQQPCENYPLNNRINGFRQLTEEKQEK